MTGRLVASSVLAVAVGLLVCGTMFAHHGLAGAYDNTIRITVQATVTEVKWTNPHVQVLFDFKNDKGEIEHWDLEQLSPGNLIRIGWFVNTFKPGDVILISFVPAKENRHFSGCGHIVSKTGTQFITGQCGVPGGDISKLPVKAGYKAVEVKFPEFGDKGQGPEGPTRLGPRSKPPTP